MSYFVYESSYIDDNVTIGEGTKIWYFCHIQSGAVIGKNCSFGQNVNVATNVTVGNDCKVQNNVSLYEGVTLEDGVFCGPSCVFTNDLTPRSRYPKGRANYKALRRVCDGLLRRFGHAAPRRHKPLLVRGDVRNLRDYRRYAS